MNKQLIELDHKVDSLYMEVDRKDQFILGIQRVLRGDTTDFSDPAKYLRSDGHPLARATEMRLEPVDTAFRKEFEESGLARITRASVRYRELQTFSSPR